MIYQGFHIDADRDNQGRPKQWIAIEGYDPTHRRYEARTLVALKKMIGNTQGYYTEENQGETDWTKQNDPRYKSRERSRKAANVLNGLGRK